MTLLSIREQETVQRALVEYGWASASSPHSGCSREEFEASERRLVAVIILATRDAIARQVREEAVRHTNNSAWLHSAAYQSAATFIEGLVCDSADTGARGR